MSSYKLMILLEIVNDCFQVFTYGRNGPEHDRARRTMRLLIEEGFVEVSGDKLVLTTKGWDATEWATRRQPESKPK